MQTDARVSDKEWAAREGMVAFAGYPLLLEDRVLGVLAMFSRQPLADDVLEGARLRCGLRCAGHRTQTVPGRAGRKRSAVQCRLSGQPNLHCHRAHERWAVRAGERCIRKLDGVHRDEILGRNTAELSVWEHQEDREAFWADLRRTGSIRERECRFRNRNGRLFTMLLSSEVIQLNHVPHMLTMALDITERKQTEAELRASEARLRESEARFSVAFEASPVFHQHSPDE